MKLELKHLAPYLPYGLKFIHQGHEYLLMQLNILYDQKPLQVNGWSDQQQTLVDVFLEGCEPILHPLSDLLKQTKGFDYLIQIVDETDQQCDAYYHWCDAYIDNPDQSRILQAPYEVFEILVKKHFDVFGLIPQGLAVDMHSPK